MLIARNRIAALAQSISAGGFGYLPSLLPKLRGKPHWWETGDLGSSCNSTFFLQSWIWTGGWGERGCPVYSGMREMAFLRIKDYIPFGEKTQHGKGMYSPVIPITNHGNLPSCRWQSLEVSLCLPSTGPRELLQIKLWPSSFSMAESMRPNPVGPVSPYGNTDTRQPGSSLFPHHRRVISE